MPGATEHHRVACHFAEQIASGELQRHEVAPELVAQTPFDLGTPGPTEPPHQMQVGDVP